MEKGPNRLFATSVEYEPNPERLAPADSVGIIVTVSRDPKNIKRGTDIIRDFHPTEVIFALNTRGELALIKTDAPPVKEASEPKKNIANKLQVARKAVVTQAYARVTRESTHSAGEWPQADGSTFTTHIGRLMPGALRQTLHALDPQKFNIQSFISLTVPQCATLLDTGSIIINGKAYRVPPELDRNSDPNAQFETKPYTAKDIFLAELKRIEADKMLSVLEHRLHAVNLRDLLYVNAQGKKINWRKKNTNKLDPAIEELVGRFGTITTTKIIDGQEHTTSTDGWIDGPLSEERQAYKHEVNYYRDILAKKMTVLRTLQTEEKTIQAQLSTSTDQQKDKDRLKAVVNKIAQQIQGLNSLFKKIEKFWQEMVSGFQFSLSDIKTDLAASNIEAIRRYTSEGVNFITGKGVPSLHNVFTLFFTETDRPLTMRELRTLLKNPEFRRLYKLADIFTHIRNVEINGQNSPSIPILIGRFGLEKEPKNETPAQKKLREQYIKEIQAGRVPIGLVERFLKKPQPFTGSISEAEQQKMSLSELEDFQRYLEKPLLDPHFIATANHTGRLVDNFLVNFARTKKIDPKILIQREEVVGASWETLQDIAFGFGPKRDKIAQWEARRKMTLMGIFHEIALTHKKAIEAGAKPIDDIEQTTFLTQGHQTYAQLEGKLQPVTIIPRREPKSFESTAAKAQDRDRINDENTKDTFGESILFEIGEGVTIEDLTCEETFTFAPNTFFTDVENISSSRKETEIPTDTVTMPKVMGTLIQSWLKAANKDGKTHLTIHEYKPLPKVGESFASGSAGGGAKIRFAKLYLWHTSSGITRKKEIQFYFARADGDNTISAHSEFEDKMAKQSDYVEQKGFAGHGYSDQVRMLIPEQVYGEAHIRLIFGGRVK